MKKIILIFLVLGFLFSCKSSKNTGCDAYGKIESPDTLKLEYA